MRWPSGIVDVVQGPPSDGTLIVEDGLSTGLVPSGSSEGVRLFPNPVKDRLSVLGVQSSSTFLRIADMAGRTVLESKLVGNGVNVSGLSSRTYAVSMVDGARLTHTSFVKE